MSAAAKGNYPSLPWLVLRWCDGVPRIMDRCPTWADAHSVVGDWRGSLVGDGGAWSIEDVAALTRIQREARA